MTSNSIKIPQGREDLKTRLIELYRTTLPEGVVDIVSQVQLRHQFTSTDEYSFRERVGYELQDAVLAVKSNHFSLSPICLYEIDKCLGFVRDWLEIIELALSEDAKSKIISEESHIVVGDLIAEARNQENYEVVRNLELFHTETSKVIFNKYVYTRL